MKTLHAMNIALLVTLIAALALVVMLLPLPVARADITGVQVIPALPTDVDSVDIRVTGYLRDACWRVGPVECGLVPNGTINIAVHAVDSWQPGTACPLVIIDYDQRCNFGRLQAGQYHVVFTEYHSSLRDPGPQQAILDFSVTSAPTPVVPITWGRLKALYR